MRIHIDISGESHTSRSRPLSAQVTKNFYREISDNPAAKSASVLMSFPGMKAFGQNGDPDRGIFEHNGILYKVSGTSLYSVSPSGAYTSLGTIAGSGRCIFEGIGSNVIVTTQGKAYQYNGSTVAEITDADLETPNSCAHLNNQIIFDGDGGRFVSSDVGDATSIDGLNYATAESDSDDLLRVYVHNQYLYLLGDKTVEAWWNSGVGSPPFDRIEGGIMQVGLAALHSVASDDSHLYFLGEDNNVYRVSGLQRDIVSSRAVHHEISGYATVSDAIGFCFTLEGQNFYCLTLPGQNRTLLFSDQSGWTELSSDGSRSFANGLAYAYRKLLISDYRNGNIYEWDLDTFTDFGKPISRVRDTAPLHGGLVGAPGLSVEMSSFEIIMETGVGTLAGQGLDPTVAIRLSDDGGKTWSTEMREKLGTLGEFQRSVRFNALGCFRERIIRVECSDPVFYAIHYAAAELEPGE